MPGVLALDLSTRGCGWAVAHRDALVSAPLIQMPCPVHGVWKLRVEGWPLDAHGKVYARLERKMLEQITMDDVTAIVMEAPLPAGASMGPNAARLQLGLAAVVDLIAEREGLNVWEIHNATLKKFATGSGNADKAMMLDAAAQKWRPAPTDHNAADALHLLDFALHRLDQWGRRE